jgi:Ca2+-binding RTX toxin-like protein
MATIIITSSGTYDVVDGNVYIIDASVSGTVNFEAASGQPSPLNFGIEINDSNSNFVKIETLDAELSPSLTIADNVDAPRLEIDFDQSDAATSVVVGDNVTLDEIKTGDGNDTVTIGDNFTANDVKLQSGNDTLSLGSGVTMAPGHSDIDLSGSSGSGDMISVDPDGDQAGLEAALIANGYTDADNDGIWTSSGSEGPQFYWTNASTGQRFDFKQFESIQIGSASGGGDGTVDGTSGDDTMLVGFVDADGDTIDGADGNDDIIAGYAGDDSIQGGEGNDVIYGGSGSDNVAGNAGDDVIYGGLAPGSGGGTEREVLEWNDAPGFSDEGTATGFTQNTGTTDVTFSIVSNSGTNIEWETANGNVDGIDSAGVGVDQSSGLAFETDRDWESAEVALDFSDPVENVDFRVNDIDFGSQVTIRAYDENGNEIPVTLTGGSNLTLSDTDSVAGNDTATSNGGGGSTTSADYSVLVQIAGPVARIEIEHMNVNGQSSHAQVTDIYFDAITGDTGVDGDDTLDGGEGDDEIYGGAGNDTIIGGAGSDTVDGGTGNDVIDTSGPNSTGLAPALDLGFPGLVAPDADPNNDKDIVYGGAGDDTITTGDDADTIFGGSGNDSINGGIDADSIDGGEGDDTIVGGEGSDVIDGGAGDDLIYAALDPSFPDSLNIPDEIDPVLNNGDDLVHGGAGNDTIYGADDNDTLYGDEGDDTLYGGIDDDVLYGGQGEDELFGGDASDTLFGGDGADVLDGGRDDDTIVAGAGDVATGGHGDDVFTIDASLNDSSGTGPTTLDIVGGETGEANQPDNSDTTNDNYPGAPNDFGDVLDLTNLFTAGLLNPGDVNYDDPSRESGNFTYTNADGDLVTVNFSEIENVIVCFTRGTMIVTDKGEKAIEDLVSGDKVLTKDNGLQELRWIGSRTVPAKDSFAPIMIKAGAMANDRDLLVSPQHRMVVEGWKSELLFGEREVLAAAKHLVNGDTIFAQEGGMVEYFHMLFDTHEIVFANGAASESFHPGEVGISALTNDAREEIFALFPELRENSDAYGPAARTSLKAHEAKVLAKNPDFLSE